MKSQINRQHGSGRKSKRKSGEVLSKRSLSKYPDYSSLEYNVNSMPHGDHVEVKLKKGQKIIGINVDVSYFSDSIDISKEMISIGSAVRRWMTGEEIRTEVYHAKEDDRMNCFYDKLGILYNDTYESVYGSDTMTCYKLDHKTPSLIITDSHTVVMITGNIGMKFQYNFTGWRSDTKVRSLRLNLEEGNIGYVWIHNPNHKILEIDDSETLNILPQYLISALLSGKSSYKIKKTSISWKKVEKDYIQIKGPAKLTVVSNDISNKLKEFHNKYGTFILPK